MFVDIAGPAVVARTPAADASGVAARRPGRRHVRRGRSTPLALTFTLRDDTRRRQDVGGTWSYDGRHPDDDLRPCGARTRATRYTATVGGAVDAGGQRHDRAAHLVVHHRDQRRCTRCGRPGRCPPWPRPTTAGPSRSASSSGSTCAGRVVGVRFHKGPGNTGTHVGRAVPADGALLGQVTFSGETAHRAGSRPTSPRRSQVRPGRHLRRDLPRARRALLGERRRLLGRRASTAAPLHALADGADGGNGVYRYGCGGVPADRQLERQQLLDRHRLPGGHRDRSCRLPDPSASPSWAPATGAPTSSATSSAAPTPTCAGSATSTSTGPPRASGGGAPCRSPTTSTTCSPTPTVGAVAVATPAHTHVAVALACLEAGKHVLVEKPLATSVDDGRKLVEVAGRRRPRADVRPHLLLHARRAAHAARWCAAASWATSSTSTRSASTSGWCSTTSTCSGTSRPHDLSILDYVLPADARPVAVAAHGADPIGAGRACVGYLTLPLANGGMAHVHVNWLSPTKVRTMHVGGSRRMVVWDDLNPAQRLSVHDRGVELSGADDRRGPARHADLLPHRRHGGSRAARGRGARRRDRRDGGRGPRGPARRHERRSPGCGCCRCSTPSAAASTGVARSSPCPTDRRSGHRPT